MMELGELIAELRKHDGRRIVPLGFANPHSYRGYYERLAFEPKRNVSIGSMLAAAQEAVGYTFQGWKGGDFTMGTWTDCYLAEEGCCGEEIGPTLLAFMLTGEPPAEGGSRDG